MRLLLALLVLALVAAIPAAAAAQPSGAQARKIVITVKSVTIAAIPNDRPPQGLGKGDRILVRDRLLNVSRQFGKAAGAAVGHDEGVFVYTSKTSARFEAVTTLPGGTLHIRGTLVTTGAPEPIIVDGGTGRYAHARGTLVIGSGSRPLNTYRLTLGKAPAASGDCPECSA